MSNNKSDNNSKPRTNVFELLPEVYRSKLNESFLENSINRHLTKDDLTRVSGFVGPKNAAALVDRQIKEETPFRQAYQLQPVMYSSVGSEKYTLTQQSFLNQLDLMGVDRDRLQQWGSVKQFNWAPPVNIDMVVNYYDYFWPTSSVVDPPQYFTVENRCRKATSKTESYRNIVERNGDIHSIVGINVANNTLSIEGDLSLLFISGFKFYTTNTSNVNFSNTLWTTHSSTYDSSTNLLTVTVNEKIAVISETPPSSVVVGRWWYKPSTRALSAWSGTSWVAATATVTCDISLSMLLMSFQRTSNCACNEDFGWDMAPWDDNQPIGQILWNVPLLNQISHETEAEWVTANGFPQARNIWYDTTNDVLLQRDDTNTTWRTAVFRFKSLYEQTTGNVLWDSTTGCVSQKLNQWSTQNRWIHKSQVTSFNGIKRAQLPILEYSSTIEQNEWTEIARVWKYRADVDAPFVVSSIEPSRLELEPVKDYRAIQDPTTRVWYLYLASPSSTVVRDVNLTAAFPAGEQVVIRDDGILNDIYTVVNSDFRNLATDTLAIAAGLGSLSSNNCYVTVLELEERVFSSSTSGSGPLNIRIEPRKTARGDVWRGYHVHWVLSEERTAKASTGQAFNPLLKLSLATPLVATPSPIGLKEVGVAHQTVTVTAVGVTHVDLDLSFSPSNGVGYYATPNSNELRVFVNGARQYGTFVESSTSFTPSYTMVGDTPTNIVTIPYVTGVTFTQPLKQFDVVRVEVGPASLADLGLLAVPVRTIEDEVQFTTAIMAGLQPQYVSLTRYELNEQSKIQTNQYPMFNIYDVVDASVVNAAPPIAYKEAADQAINTSVARRIVATADGRDFTFVQNLVSEDNGRLFGYRDFDLAPSEGTLWYSALLGKVMRWVDNTWTDIFVVSTSKGTALRRCVVQENSPTVSSAKDGDLWFRPSTKTLYIYTPSVNTTTFIVSSDAVVVSDADPTLRTVWRNTNDYHYVPSYVDENKNPVPVGSVNGDWELLSPWVNNSEHRNLKESTFSQLVTHFSSMINSQEKVPGLPSGGRYSFEQNEYNYSAGGTIKEHNDSFDTLISAVNITSTTPIGLLEWARSQYDLGLLLVRDSFNRNLISLFSSYSPKDMVFLADTVSASLVKQIKFNDFLSYVYGDTTAYNSTTLEGVPNWIATIPMLRLGLKYRPHVIYSGSTVELFHHDGHRSRIYYTAGEIDRFARELANVDDSRVSHGKLGVVDSGLPSTSESAFTSVYGGTEVRTGVYWYRVVGGIQTVYRFTPVYVGTVDPSLNINGVELPDGVKYYNTQDNTVRTKVGTGWHVTASGGDISSLWEEISFAEHLAHVMYNIELKLYGVATAESPVFDYSTLHSTPADTMVYNSEMEKRFVSYVTNSKIKAPYINTEYVAVDPFTWNYYDSILVSLPRASGEVPHFACWQALYTYWYGTPYPHLEPWKLQGFRDKPTWWDEEYLETSGLRRWKYNHATHTGMWENIRIGAIPAGRPGPGVTVPTYSYMSVNISDSVLVGGYEPDSLLPPYYDTADSSVRSLFSNYVIEIINPNADYAFGEVGPTEWQWLVSSSYVYDKPIVAFTMSPVKFLHSAFGVKFIDVDGLQVDVASHRVYSHTNALFHGDVYDGTKMYVANGLNQWYANYNRFSGYDTNDEFRQLWVKWVPKQSYLFGGIVDANTFNITARYFDVVDEDYTLQLTNTGVFKDVWIEGFEISVTSIPPAIIQHNNESLWRFELDTLATIDRTLTVYGVRQYPFTVDVALNVCSLGSVTLPWLTGQQIVLSSTKLAPFPLSTSDPYFIIRVDSHTFKLAETYADAMASIAVDITTVGTGTHTVGEIRSSFNVYGGQSASSETWYHYELDKTVTYEVSPPTTVHGMQSLVNILDGYAEFQRDSGVVYNLSDGAEYDEYTGRAVNWQFEVERFIDWTYNLRRSRLDVADRYGFALDSTPPTQYMTFGAVAPSWVDGTRIVFSTTGTLPSPLIAGAVYYYVSGPAPGQFSVSITSNTSILSNRVTLTTSGSGDLYAAVYGNQTAFPSFEINPTRNNVWINTPQGVLSNVITGPYGDIRVSQTIFDQHGNPLTPDKFNVYRHDLMTHVEMRPLVADSLNLIPTALKTQYDYLHIGGGHFFIEGYEHVLALNDYTVGGALIYDQFYGMSASRFTLDYYEKTDYTLRPTLGGHYLVGGKFVRNMEGSTVDLHDYYDTYNLREGTVQSRYGRHLLGFDGTKDYFNLVNLSEKSQFLFHRGMLRYKGSVAGSRAFINSRRFIDAKVDEFWAWKIAEYGDTRPRVYPAINLLASDAKKHDLRLHFLAPSESVSDPDVIEATSNDFSAVEWSSASRWNIYPEQKADIVSPLFLDSRVTSMWKVYFSDVEPVAGQTTVDFWYDTVNSSLKRWTGVMWSVVSNPPVNIRVTPTTTYVKLDCVFDDVRVVHRKLLTPHDLQDYETHVYAQEESVEGFVKVNSEVVKLGNAAVNDVLIFFTINPGFDSSNPSKLFDHRSNTTVTTAQMWDPARNWHSTRAIHNVTLSQPQDPARYMTTLSHTSPDAWSHTQTETVWLDTGALGYKHYYDDRLYTDISDRLNNWGELAEWADVRVYEWTASSVPPAEWEKAGELQAGDLLRPQRSKATGSAKQTLFKRSRHAYPASIASGRVRVPTHTFSVGDVVMFTTTGTLPAPLQPATFYSVISVIGDDLALGDVETNDPVVITGTGSFTVVESFPRVWERSPVISTTIFGSMIDSISSYPHVGGTTLSLDPADGWSQYDVVDVYINDVLVLGGWKLDDTTTVDITNTIQEHDIITVVRPEKMLSSTEQSFDPDTNDDGTTMVQWKYDYEYSTVITYDGNTARNTYYFWVRDSQYRHRGEELSLSAYEIAAQLRTIPTPYFTVHVPKDDPTMMVKYGFGVAPWGSEWSLGALNEQALFIPVLYREAVLHKASSYITEDNRYTWTFTRNLALRAKNDDNLKNKHEEWYTFRRAQPQNVPRELWDKLTEALIGYTLADSSVRVPSMERELYDGTNGTDTRFGLGAGQAFCDKDYAIDTIVAYLKDPGNDFSPISIDAFFNTHSFDTPTNIRVAMEDIYNTFSTEHVNTIWFETLQDALATRAKYKDLMKTSWVALHGIRVLEVGGLFDD